MFGRFLKDEHGGAVVELAFVAPAIAVLALMSIGVWDGTMRQQEMRAALGAGVAYYMGGGSDDTMARTVALAAWSEKPDDGDIVISRTCRCGNATVSCSALCPSSAPPAEYVHLQATGTAADTFYSKAMAGERVIRAK